MARLIRTARTALPFFSCCASKTLVNAVQRHPNPPLRKAISASLFHSRHYASEALSQSPMEANILRIIRNEVEYQSEYAPPQQPAMKFESFTVQDRPGEQWITMRRRFGDTEDIKIEVTMFDGYETAPKTGDDSSGEDVRLQLSMLVDITKGDDSKDLEFLCSAWPDRLEVQKVYVLERDRMLAKPYMGPDFRSLNGRIQQRFSEYLEARGVNDELSVFLHQYMMNKDRIELIKWLGKVKSFVEK
nr:uncharacterized protein At2g39795, mitochondrial [Malus domestica]XP_008378807.2 uncharacterized protein At2g39795, mitochondrial [Malus domestica]XP_028950150.1 uncharacterized protein At2g39795, mitochondrial [Malus domestica]